MGVSSVLIYTAIKGLRGIVKKPHDCYWGDGLCVKKSLLKVEILVKPQALVFVGTVEYQEYTSSFEKTLHLIIGVSRCRP